MNYWYKNYQYNYGIISRLLTQQWGIHLKGDNGTMKQNGDSIIYTQIKRQMLGQGMRQCSE